MGGCRFGGGGGALLLRCTDPHPAPALRPLDPCSYNIWHTWDEGLMGAFATLREQGLLPMVQVDAEGNMR